MSSFWLVVRRLLFRSRRKEIQDIDRRRTYSLQCIEEEEEEDTDEEKNEEEGDKEDDWWKVMRKTEEDEVEEEEEEDWWEDEEDWWEEPTYCDDSLEDDPLPGHLVPGFSACQELTLLEGTKFPRKFLLDWEAGKCSKTYTGQVSSVAFGNLQDKTFFFVEI